MSTCAWRDCQRPVEKRGLCAVHIDRVRDVIIETQQLAPPPPAGHDGCPLCGDRHWVSIPDPLFGGALVDQRCPACEDTTVRATKPRWNGDNGERSGPQ
jgi:hypothetical protein